MARRRRCLMLAIPFVFALVTLFAPSRREMGWIDAVSGSMKHQTQWLLSDWIVFETRSVMERSALEEWIIEHEGIHRHDWRHVNGTRTTLWSREFGHDQAPAIYQLRRVLDDYVRLASDEEIAEFVRQMRTGTEAEQEAAVEQAFAIVFHETEESAR